MPASFAHLSPPRIHLFSLVRLSRSHKHIQATTGNKVHPIDQVSECFARTVGMIWHGGIEQGRSLHVAADELRARRALMCRICHLSLTGDKPFPAGELMHKTSPPPHTEAGFMPVVPAHFCSRSWKGAGRAAVSFSSSRFGFQTSTCG